MSETRKRRWMMWGCSVALAAAWLAWTGQGAEMPAPAHVGEGAGAHAAEDATAHVGEDAVAYAGEDAAAGEYASRTVWACDRRKQVIVEGVRPGEKIPHARAELVADVLMDLVRYCNEEIVASIGVDQRIRVSARGLVYEDYVPGGPLPIVQVSFGQPTARERRVWDAALKKLVDEGDRLFHSDEIGNNGIACAMCHPHASNTHPETYPKFQTQLKKVVLLRDMTNWCIENPLEGEPLAADDPRMAALEAYMIFQRNGKAIEAGKH